MPVRSSFVPRSPGMETGTAMIFFSVSWADSLSMSQAPVITSEMGRNIWVLPQTTLAKSVWIS